MMWTSLWLLLVTTAAIILITADNCNGLGGTQTGAPNGVIVHLFEWRFDDIANECEKFLGPKGFGGVQVSPVSENLIVSGRPWNERYQPVSYNIVSRSGNETEFHDMVRRCNSVGVKIYVDVVLNHMTAASTNDAKGVGGSTADTINFLYPAVPYTKDDFNQANCSVSNNDNATEVRDCELNELHDLNQTRPCVRYKQREFLNKLISFGVAGFRVDAAKHMYPENLANIFNRLNYLNIDHGFACESEAYIYQNIVGSGKDGAVTADQYYSLGLVTDFKYGYEISHAFRGKNPLKWFYNFGEEWDLLKSDKSVVFIDNHDTERGDGYGGKEILTHDDAKLYKMAVAFMLAWPHGQPSLLSSYYFNTTNQGPPSNKDESIQNVVFAGDICTNGWACEHRWREIYDMVEFRNVVGDENVTMWWTNDNNQIAFSRGSKGFIVFNVDTKDIEESIKTGLPTGNYCDVISGKLESGKCTGKSVTVDDNGNAKISLKTSEQNGVLAIHIGAKY